MLYVLFVEPSHHLGHLTFYCKVYFAYFESFIMYRNTCRPRYVSKKAYLYLQYSGVVSGFIMLGLDGRVGAIPT